MQPRKTKPIEMPDELPPLTVQEQALVEALGEGLNQTEAYQRAYGAEGYSRSSLSVRACQKIAEPKIKAHLSMLRAAGFHKAVISRDDRIIHMMARAEQAKNEGAWSACAAFEQEANKLAGLHVERVEIIDRRPEDSLAAIATLAPDLAAALAQQHGLSADVLPKSSTQH